MSLLEKYQRINNTFSYSFQSSQGVERADEDGGAGVDTGDEIADFQFEIPPFPFATNQQSKLGIFTLESFYFTSQTETAYVSSGDTGLPTQTDYDISNFFVEISGLGIKPHNFTTGKSSNLRGQNIFHITNEYGSRRKADDDTHISSRVNSGGECNQSIICSNPSGTIINVKVFSGDSGNQIVDQDTIDSIIKFKVELLPDDFQEREIE